LSAEKALDKAKSILESGNRLAAMLQAIDSETTAPVLSTPAPRSFRIGSYLGREEILAEIPAVTIEARATVEDDDQEEWFEGTHGIWVWAFVTETDPEHLHRYVSRYAEAIRRVLKQRRYWGGGWHNIRIRNTLYTNVFQARHFMLAGCRVELEVGEMLREES
jgi:hypothetical protein